MLISWGEEKGGSGFDVGGCQQKKKMASSTKIYLPSLGSMYSFGLPKAWAQTKMTSYPTPSPRNQIPCNHDCKLLSCCKNLVLFF
jgi:hypothetical protein